MKKEKQAETNIDTSLSSNQFSNEIELNSLSYNSYSFSTGRLNTDNIPMDDLKEYVKYPMIYNEILRTISRQYYSLNGLYGQSIDRMVALPTLSYITTLRNKSPQMKEKKTKFNTLLKILNIDRTTRDILRHLFVDGSYVGILRDTTTSNKNIDASSATIESIDRLEGLSLDDNFMIQPLDLDYCKIVGFQNNVSIAAFDMMYFDQFKYGGLLNEIKNFPKDFVKAYMAYKKDVSKRWFILDYRKTIVLKAKANEIDAFGVPFGVSAFTDMKSSEDYDNSQYQLISELASSIYYLVLPTGEKTGSCSLNKDQQNEVISAFKNAVKINTSGNSTKISTLSLAPGTQIDRLSKDSSLIKDTLSDENIKKIATGLGIASSALNAESRSANLGSLQINLDLISAQVFQYINEIAKEETRVINDHLGITPNSYIDIKFLPITWLNKKDVYEKAKDLYLTAGGSRMFYIAAAGFDPEDYLSICDEEVEAGFDERYAPHITSYTATDSADTANEDGNLGGRPQKDTSELKESGLITKNLKSNEQRVENKK
ncbi:MAG: hypothetical protein PHX62_04610 [Bacilli bacterium]|nr:hypothetical protein [Bacilli bacterium]